MKKILTASLVAIMAVTAANADIASTVYVDNAKTAALADAAADAKSKADAALADAKVYADGLNTTMAGRVDTLEADVSSLVGEGTESVEGQIDSAVGNLGNLGNGANGQAYGTVADAIAGEVKELADGAVAENTANIAKLNGDANTAGSVAKAVADAKAELQGQINNKANKATTLSGYGITDAYTKTEADNKFQTKAMILTANEVNDENKKSDVRYVSAAAAETIAQDAVGVLTNGIADMDADKSATTGYVMTGVVQEDGKITEIKQAQITNDYIANNAAIVKTKLATDVQTSLGKADSAMQLAALKAVESYTNNGCASAGVICSLVSNGGNIAWEKVIDAAAAAAE